MEDADGSTPEQWYSRNRVCEVNIGVGKPHWVLFDPTNNLYFASRDGSPLSALELFKLYGSAGDIVAVRGMHIPVRAAGPAFCANPVSREWMQVLTVKQVNSMHAWLDVKDHLVYYDNLVYMPEGMGTPARCLMFRGRPRLTRHWGKPLHEALGVTSIEYVRIPAPESF